MRSLIGILVIVGLIVKFIWWIVGAAALVALFYLGRSMIRQNRARTDALARQRAAMAARAEQQHQWVLDGDDRGIYGQYPIADIVVWPARPRPTKAPQGYHPVRDS